MNKVNPVNHVNPVNYDDSINPDNLVLKEITNALIALHIVYWGLIILSSAVAIGTLFLIYFLVARVL